ncbi:MAG: IPT/TIG domain-containing protein, partial [Gaiellaceae bacterium]
MLTAFLTAAARFLLLIGLSAAPVAFAAGSVDVGRAGSGQPRSFSQFTTKASRSLAAAASAPTIAGFSPTSGGPGTAVTITGTNFTGATAVAFNGAVAVYTVNTDAQITATVPAGATSGAITVTTPGGQATTAGSAPMSFVSVGVARAPSGITSLAAVLPSGYQAGDLLIAWLAFADNAQSITGMTGWTEFPWSPLDDGTLWHVRCFYKFATDNEVAPTVKWTNNAKPVFQIAAWRGVNQTSPVVASVGALDRGSGNNVVGPSGTNQSASAWAIAFFAFRSTYSADKNASFSSFTPSGLTKRADSNLGTSAYAAWVNVATADSSGPVGVGSHQYTGMTTATQGSGHKAGALIYLAPAASGNFTVLAPPTISGFNPTSGAPGAAVTITGTNLNGATAVAFNGTTASYTINSSTQITATVPAPATSGPISVITPG